MNQTPLTTHTIAWRNMLNKPVRTVILILLTAIFAFVLFSSTMLMKSLENGVESLSQRLGADILAVPTGYEADFQSTLLRGEPSGFYFDAEFTDKIAAVEGVDAVSPQLYLATLNAGCCAYPIQMIGYDPQSDFIVHPWMDGQNQPAPKDGEIVVGNSIAGEPGQTIKFFDQNFTIAARLEKTGMGFDTSVFMNMDTARKVLAESDRIQGHPAKGKNMISSALIRMESGYSAKDVANQILQQYAKEGVHVIVTKNMISDISGTLRGISSYLSALAIGLWIVAVGVLTLVFSVTFHERKKEFSLYRVLGAPKRLLTRLVLWEASLISLAGAVSGTLLSMCVIFPFSTYISTTVGLPYLSPSVGTVLLTALFSTVAAFTAGPLASLYCVIQLGKTDIHTGMTEER